MLFSSSFYTIVVSDGLHEPYLLLTNSSIILILSDSQRGCLIWVKFVEIPKQNFESQLNASLNDLKASLNDLPANVVEVGNLSRFKIALKSYTCISYSPSYSLLINIYF